MKHLLFLILISTTYRSVSAQIWGNLNTRTEARDDAGASGSERALSGFFETVRPQNFPAVPVANAAANWWHLLDVRHSNPSNNFAMQFSGSFFDQQLYFRKTTNSPGRSWNRILQEIDGKIAIGQIDPLTNHGTVNLAAGNWGDEQNPNYAVSVDANFVIGNNKTFRGAGGLQIEKYGGSWIDMPVQSGASAIGSNGAGKDAWIAYAFTPGEWFTNTQQGDICYRNEKGRLLFGNSHAQNATMTITGNKIGIGTLSPSEILSVAGNIKADGNITTRKIKVTQSDWPDYVFEPSYRLPSLEQVEDHITSLHPFFPRPAL